MTQIQIFAYMIFCVVMIFVVAYLMEMVSRKGDNKE